MNRFFASFKYALEGLGHIIKNHPNFKFHLLAALTVLITSIVLKVSATEFIILLFGITFVLIAEMINTAIEEITNLVTTEHKKEAKIAKDVGAASVLLASALAIIMGIIIFLPHLLRLIS